MELKVWVEGIQRVICGVNQNTTSQDVIVALAQATGKTGRFTLIEQWRDSEHLLTPSDNPLRVLQKYGEYANDVHFILRQSDSGQKARFTHNFTPPPPAGGIVKRNLTFSGAHNSPTNVFPPQHKQKPKTPSHAIIEESDDGYPNENHGRPPKPKQPPPYYMVERMLQDNIQKGRVIQENGRSSHNTYNAGGEREHRQNRKSPHVGNLVHGQADGNGEWYSTHGNVETHEFVVRQPEVRRGMNNDSYNSLERKSRRRMEASTGDGNYNSLERKNRHKGPTQYSSPYSNSDQSGERRAPISMGSDAYDISVTPETKKTNRDTPEKESPMWSRRSPDGRSPPGSRSPVKSWKEIHETEADVEEFDLDRSLFEENGDDRLKRFHEKVMTPKISREQLLRLINLQQQKLETQDSQMSATTTDLTSMENRERDFTEKMETIHAEAHDLEVSDQQLTEEIKENDAVRWEDEIEVQKQLEKTLRTELTLVAAKLVNCESELVQCKNETRALTEEIEQEKQEQELLLQQAKEEHARMLEKVEHLKKKLEAAEKLGDADKKTLEEIESEIKQLETQLEEKSNEVTQIENDIKQANLLQFTGKVKPEKQDKDDKSSRSNSPAAGKVGSIRKMMGSPQLLGETVPTARNPQGLWV